MENENKESNVDSQVNVEKVMVDGHEVKYVQEGEGDKATYDIEMPDALKDDKDFTQKFNKAKSLIATQNSRGLNNNQWSKRLDEREALILKREANAKIQEETQIEIPSTVDLMMEDLGLSEVDIDLMEYSERKRAEDKANAKIANMRNQQASRSQLANTFIANGGDYNGLLTFANSLGAKISKALINTYEKTLTGGKPNFATNNLANIQKTQIRILPKGSITAKKIVDTPAGKILKLANEKNRL